MKSFIYSQLPSTLKKIFFILPKGDPFKIVVLFLLMMVAAGFEIAGIGMIPAFVAIVADPEIVLNEARLKPLFSLLGITSERDLLIGGAIAMLGVFVLKSAYIIAFNFFESRFIYNRRYIIMHRLMSSYMQASYTFHLKRNTAEILRNILQEVTNVINIVITNLLKMAREGIIVIGILIFLFSIEPLITLVTIVLSGAGAGSFIMFNRKKMKDFGEEEQARRQEMIKAVNQGLGGIKEARVLNRENEFIYKFKNEAHASTRLLAYIKFIQQIPKPVVETTAVFGMLLIALLLVWEGRPMNAIIPILTLFAMATVRLMPSVQQLSSMYTNLRYHLVSLNPVYEDLKELDVNNIKFVTSRHSGKEINLTKQITLDEISYAYPESEELAIKDVSLTITKGEVVAFVGESGAGKTTMVDLILGLLAPTQGTILLDGLDVNQNISAWQRNIGYIPQSIYLSDDSVRKNIAFGLPDSEIDEEKIRQAVKLSQLESMIISLPSGLDTIIGENGTRLSGGQRQRIGIARALYHDPQVLIMDEATSALDNITEKEITSAIENLKGDRTIIMIAHRLTTVKNCDTLYFMKNGEIIQKGTYKELVDSNKQFRRMAMEV